MKNADLFAKIRISKQYKTFATSLELSIEKHAEILLLLYLIIPYVTFVISDTLQIERQRVFHVYSSKGMSFWSLFFKERLNIFQ